jgi:hypothetical protein
MPDDPSILFPHAATPRDGSSHAATPGNVDAFAAPGNYNDNLASLRGSRAIPAGEQPIEIEGFKLSHKPLSKEERQKIDQQALYDARLEHRHSLASSNDENSRSSSSQTQRLPHGPQTEL